MGNVYHVNKKVGLALLVAAAAALATIIALSVAYNNEKSKNRGAGAASASSASTPLLTSVTPKHPWDHYRLPSALLPLSYSVMLWPRLEPDEDGLYVFTGHSLVIFTCMEETDLVIIHSNKLNLTTLSGHHAKLQGLDRVSPPAIERSWLVEKTQFLVLQLKSRLLVGASYTLYTEFRGELADDLQGFYRSEYTEDGVKKTIIATSQMQATHARKTFPCFDEPAMKAVFNVTIIHDQAFTALSNSRKGGHSNKDLDGRRVTETFFVPTKKMSSYLLAFIVTDFGYIQSNKYDFTLRIWARRNAIQANQGAYALEVTGKILRFYEQYFRVKYPLSKSDQIALPDFHAGAMENWGLITYRETALLYDPVSSSVGNKERVVTVIAHELAHMWFGNLVTLKWWNDLWLNEGFASYVEYLGADFAEPTWNIKDLIILYDVHHVFAVDALASSHPLSCAEEEVNNPAQISEMFGSISYRKGAAVLRMLSDFLTEAKCVTSNFQSYLNTFAFKNAVVANLWDHLQQAAENTAGLYIPRTVHDIMDRWTLQMGFPVVTVDTQTGRVSQKHFLLDPESVVERPSKFNYVWFVPIKWMKSGVQQPQYWLLQETGTSTQMKVSGEAWVLANLHISGYYRVNYDPTNWERLISLLGSNHMAIPVINRAQIIDDAFNLARAKMINITLALRTTKYLSRERDFIPWESALRNLDYFTLMLDRTEVYEALQAYLKKQIQPLFEHFRTITANWTKIPERHTDQYNQINAIMTACSVGEESCRELTRSWFRKWMENPASNPIHPNLKSSVYCSAIANGGVEEWNFAWSMFRNATLASEASRLRGALACTRQPWLLNKYLKFSLDPTKIRRQDSTSTIQSVAANVVGMPLAWNFIRENWDHIFQQFGKESFVLSRLVSRVTSRFSTEFELQELKRFHQEKSHTGFGSATLAMEQALEKTAANIKWVKENRAQVLRWLQEETA
uniref:Aminopeptidase n=1 Tax=Tetraodon nigroviridis TaxID=99883 RepID=H3D2Z0_TETNG